jgi:hypothetical protein
LLGNYKSFPIEAMRWTQIITTLLAELVDLAESHNPETRVA